MRYPPIHVDRQITAASRFSHLYEVGTVVEVE
jgi:hypothetical protein